MASHSSLLLILAVSCFVSLISSAIPHNFFTQNVRSAERTPFQTCLDLCKLDSYLHYTYSATNSICLDEQFVGVEDILELVCDIPVVDIDVILQNGNASTTPSPPVHPQVNANLVTSTAASDTLVIQNQNLSNDLDDQALILPSQQPDVVTVQAVTSGPSDHSNFQHETENSLFATLSPSSSHSQQEKPATPPRSVSTLSTLVDSQSTPTDTQIMEPFPSTIINNEALETSVVGPLTTPPIHCAFESPSHFTVLGDVDEVETEPSSSFNLTRGGRESKPPIKYQSLEWKTVRGRGKHGRRGRGSSH
ncbi:unnamed protein product [Brassica oleracea]